MLFSEFKNQAVSLLENIAFNSDSFDAVLSTLNYVAQYATQETGHVINPEFYLDELNDKLKDIAFTLACPNMDS